MCGHWRVIRDWSFGAGHSGWLCVWPLVVWLLVVPRSLALLLMTLSVGLLAPRGFLLLVVVAVVTVVMEVMVVMVVMVVGAVAVVVVLVLVVAVVAAALGCALAPGFWGGARCVGARMGLGHAGGRPCLHRAWLQVLWPWPHGAVVGGVR